MLARLLDWLLSHVPDDLFDVDLSDDDGLSGTCPIHNLPTKWEGDAPTGRLRCDGCDAAYAHWADDA